MERDCLDCPRAEEGIVCSHGYHKPCADHRAKKQADRAATLANLRVRTENVYPPIPIRDYDWSAVDDNTYDGPGNPIGWGKTEQAAIDDLIEQFQER